jgi:type II secretory pathway component PulC
LEAIESAEKAVLHAVEQEVGTIFHELEHHEDKKVAKQAEKVVKQSVKKATEKAEETAKHRREWLADSQSSIEEYLCMDFE